MTVVVYRDRVLAADSRESADRDRIDSDKKKKIWRLPDGSLFGAAGSSVAISHLLDQIKKASKQKNKTLPTGLKGCTALLIDPKDIWYFEKGYWMEITEEDYLAIGSGATVAYGALEAGASAVEAVKAAIKRNVYCGGRVQKLEL